MITDEKVIARAQAGPDVHCIYCGTRNPAGAETCRQCGGDLTQAVARDRGRVVGAYRSEPAAPVRCPSCGSKNEATALRCQACGASLAETRRPDTIAEAEPGDAPRKSRRGLWIGIGVAAVALIVIYFILAGHTEGVVGLVQETHWMRSIAIEVQQPVSHESWRDEIPADGVLVGCQEKLHHTETDPVANAKKVCGTPYTVDLGSGAGEVVQDCEYEVYADWCEYTLQEWQEVDAYVLTGDDHSPTWPEPTLGGGERQGERLEVYTVIFATDDDTFAYEPEDLDEYNQFQVDSQWMLEVNALNHLVGVTPAP